MREYRATSRTPYHISCGGVVYRKNAHTLEVAVLYRGPNWHRTPHTWHLPKGTLTEEESLENCARREIEEETGLKVELEAYLGSTIRDIPDKGFAWQKTTHYYLAKAIGGDASLMDHEHERVDWLSPDEAILCLDANDKFEGDIIKRALSALS